MKVSLLSYTPNPDDVVTASARLCYSDENAMDILEHTNEKTKKGLIKHLLKSGHTSTFEHVSFTFSIEGISRNCYDKETEVLTWDGWKLFKDIDINADLFATRNNDGKVEFHKARNKIEYIYNGKMHHYTTQNTDLMITPNHNILMKKYDVRTSGDFTLKKSNDISVNRIYFTKEFNFVKKHNDDKYIIIPGYEYERKNNNGGTYIKYTGDVKILKYTFIKLLAWYLAEGSTYYDKNENKYVISIAQIDDKYKKEIKEIITSCGFNAHITDTYIRFNSLTLGNFFKELGVSYQKYIPFNIFDFFTKKTANIFLNEYEKSDASTDNGHIKFYTTSKTLADQLYNLSFIAGNTANMWTDDRVGFGHFNKKTNNYIKHNYKCYVISISKTKRNRQPVVKRKKHLINKDYNDYVYCVEVPNHTLLVRRNGKAIWCGNCSHQLVRHRLASYSQKSQRYNTEKFSDDVIIYPEAIKNSSDEIKQLYYNSFKRSFDDYQKLLDMGIKKEDARYVLPHGWETKIVVTMNARSLHHFFNLRTCRRSQKEIQELAKEMLRLVRPIAPLLFEKAGPDCIFGSCNESNSCGDPYKNIEDLLR